MHEKRKEDWWMKDVTMLSHRHRRVSPKAKLGVRGILEKRWKKAC
jgi:nucleoside-specific outer membrane channel protein Tsx